MKALTLWSIQKLAASEDAKSKEPTFTVKGTFEAAKLVQAINDAGYHVKVDKAERAK